MSRAKNRNAGFSLVELIIVIAIMAALVGVLAPQFIKYVENSRRAVDIQNAVAIREAVIVEMASRGIAGSGSLDVNEDMSVGGVGFAGGAIAIEEIPKVRGNVYNKGGYFYVKYDGSTGVCKVYNSNPDVSGAIAFDLTDATEADAYRNYGRD